MGNNFISADFLTLPSINNWGELIKILVLIHVCVCVACAYGFVVDKGDR